MGSLRIWARVLQIHWSFCLDHMGEAIKPGCSSLQELHLSLASEMRGLVLVLLALLMGALKPHQSTPYLEKHQNVGISEVKRHECREINSDKHGR